MRSNQKLTRMTDGMPTARGKRETRRFCGHRESLSVDLSNIVFTDHRPYRLERSTLLEGKAENAELENNGAQKGDDSTPQKAFALPCGEFSRITRARSRTITGVSGDGRNGKKRRRGKRGHEAERIFL